MSQTLPASKGNRLQYQVSISRSLENWVQLQGYDWTKQTLVRYWFAIDSFEFIEFLLDRITRKQLQVCIMFSSKDQTYVAIASVKFIEFEMFDLISLGSPAPCEFYFAV